MRRWLTRAVVLTAGATLGFGGVAAAAGPHPSHSGDDDTTTTSSTTPTPPVVAATDTVTLPLFGAPLTVDVSTDPSGQLAGVALNPADSYTAVVDRPNKVAFVNDDGTGKVRVEARHGGQSVSAKGSTITDISGPGSWSGEPFDDGTPATVNFTIAATADGGPDVVGVSATGPSATVGDTQHHSGSRGSQARASVTFSSGGQQRTLWITAVVAQFDETSRASVGVTLSKIRGVAQDPAEAAGAKTWTGMLCDASTATIAYTVGADGTLSDVSATPADAQVTTSDTSADVRFATGERVRISVRTKDDKIKVSVDQRFRCDTTDPSVNTPISTLPDDHGGDHGDRDHGGDGHWPGKGDDHGSTPTTTDGTSPSTSVRDDSGRRDRSGDGGGDHRSGGDDSQFGRGGDGSGGRG